MIDLATRLGFAVVVLFMCSQTLAEAPLKHDPFARPSLPTSQSQNAISVEGGSTALEEAPWSPTLIAVMVAGKHSIVNVDGVIIKIGEEFDGYRLIEVRDREAIFTKGNQRVVVGMEVLSPRENKERGIR